MSPAGRYPGVGLRQAREGCLSSPMPLRPHLPRQVPLNKLYKDTVLVWVFLEADPETNIAVQVFCLGGDPRKR